MRLNITKCMTWKNIYYSSIMLKKNVKRSNHLIRYNHYRFILNFISKFANIYAALIWNDSKLVNIVINVHDIKYKYLIMWKINTNVLYYIINVYWSSVIGKISNRYPKFYNICSYMSPIILPFKIGIVYSYIYLFHNP